jgi:ribosomal protein S18 acetylase RimI-like enzyme
MIRNARVGDVEALTTLWCDGWQDAHAAILPARLRDLRSRDSFRERIADGLERVRVAILDADIAGFWMGKGDELDQFYVGAAHRGATVAPALMEDALTSFRRSGTPTVWLACAIGNARAARFYEKQGWRNAGVMTRRLSTTEGVFPLDVWRYEKTLSAGDV